MHDERVVIAFDSSVVWAGLSILEIHETVSKKKSSAKLSLMWSGEFEYVDRLFWVDRKTGVR